MCGFHGAFSKKGLVRCYVCPSQAPKHYWPTWKPIGYKWMISSSGEKIFINLSFKPW
jgi:hypothetical protein